MVTQPSIRQRRNGKLLVNDESAGIIRFGTELRHNTGITKFMWEGKEYGCFPIRTFPSTVKAVHPLKVEGVGRRFFTAYIECFHVDGNPYNSVYWTAVDMVNKQIYACWVMGRAEVCRFSVDSATMALKAAAENGDYANTFDVYDTM